MHLCGTWSNCPLQLRYFLDLQAADGAVINCPQVHGKTDLHWFQIAASHFQDGSLLEKLNKVQRSVSNQFFNHLNDCLLDNQEQIRTLSLEKQLDNLKAKYAEPGLLTHPLLPPYKPLQLLAIEADLGIRFPAILRSYLLHISRQQAITNQRSCVGLENVHLDPFSGELSLELPDSNCGPWYGPSLLTLKGFHRGFVSMIYGRDKWESIYHCMMRPAIRDDSIIADWYQQQQSKKDQAIAEAGGREVQSVSI